MQHSQGPDHVIVKITEKIDLLPKSQSEHCIYRVHNQLRMVNEKAYDPGIVAIGPYHRGKKTLKMMEEHKLRYLNSLLKRRKDNVEVYVEAVRSLEDKARKCYSELPELNSHEFIEMLVLDGCFIVELLRKFKTPLLRDNNDPIFIIDWIMEGLQRDLMLFENQIPFFVLFKLFNMTEDPNPDTDFTELAVRFFNDLLPGPGYFELADENWHDQTKHLLGMLHDNWLPLFPGPEQPKDMIQNRENWRLIHCATELREFGVNFAKADDESFLLDIRFKNGTMEIPRLIIEDRTESFFRNLIAYEQYCQHIHHSHVISYAKLLDCLIDSPKDVEMLCRYGIIDNWLGDDEAVSEMFNKINYFVTHPSSQFHYIDIFNKVNAHCNRRANRWMSNLRRKYLNSPWGVISILGASTLLLLTFAQTVYTILSYAGK